MKGENKHIIGISFRKNRIEGEKMETLSTTNFTESSDVKGSKEVPQNRAPIGNHSKGWGERTVQEREERTAGPLNP